MLSFLHEALFVQSERAKEQLAAAVRVLVPGTGKLVVCLHPKQLRNAGQWLDQLIVAGSISIHDWWTYSLCGAERGPYSDCFCIVFVRNGPTIAQAIPKLSEWARSVSEVLTAARGHLSRDNAERPNRYVVLPLLFGNDTMWQS